jgi:uncharacterized membrane protein
MNKKTTFMFIRQNKFLSLLIFFTLLFILLTLARLMYAQTTHKIFLIWNLFLAWVPVLVLIPLHKKKSHIIKIILIIIWFIFLPNALYTITDLKHIGHSSNFILYWLDIFLLFGIAVLGTGLSLFGLEYGERKIREFYGHNTAVIVTLVVLCTSGFGIYLGRFPRLNSWYIFSDPISVIRTISESIQTIATNTSYFFFVLIFTIFYCTLYATYKKFKSI